MVAMLPDYNNMVCTSVPSNWSAKGVALKEQFGQDIPASIQCGFLMAAIINYFFCCVYCCILKSCVVFIMVQHCGMCVLLVIWA